MKHGVLMNGNFFNSIREQPRRLQVTSDKRKCGTRVGYIAEVRPGTQNLTEWGARVGIVLVFAALAVLNLLGIPRKLPIDSLSKVLDIAAFFANFMFLALVASTVLTRLRPVLKASGIEPRISAFVGTYLSVGLSLLPKADLGPALSVTSTLLIVVGTTCSYIVLRWLGKSFSLCPEARQLVTTGPYKIVRHPLYLCEVIALIGLTLQVMSPQAILISTVIVALQFRRMLNEEAVLRSAFPEYRVYAARTPRVIPGASQAAEVLRTGTNPNLPPRQCFALNAQVKPITMDARTANHSTQPQRADLA
jgi:protein-S-isoprenylcysteine O-methyltransferase Ste14